MGPLLQKLVTLPLTFSVAWLTTVWFTYVPPELLALEEYPVVPTYAA